MVLFGTLLARRPDISVPTVLYAQGDMILMTRGAGQHLPPPHHPVAALDLLLASFIYTSCLHGIAHGDMHLGNFLVSPDNRVCLLDFGLVLTVDRYDENPFVLFVKAKLCCTASDVRQFLCCISCITDGTTPTTPALVQSIQEIFQYTRFQGFEALDPITEMVRKHGCILQTTNTMYLGQYSLLYSYYTSCKKRRHSEVVYALKIVSTLCVSVLERNWVRRFLDTMMCLEIGFHADATRKTS